MNTVGDVQLLDFPFHVDAIKAVLKGMLFVGFDDDGLLLLVESQDLQNHPRSGGELTNLVTLAVMEVEVVIAVFLTLADEEIAVPRQEQNRVEGLHVLVAGLLV